MHMSRLFQGAASLLFALTVAFGLSGCFGGPPDGVIEQAIAKKHLSIQPGVFFELGDYKVTNQYSRQIDGETVYTVDYAGKITPSAALRQVAPNMHKDQSIRGAVSMVKRGDAWYILN